MTENNNIHPTAVIDPSAILGENLDIGPFAVIGHDVKIGDGTKLHAHAVIHPYTTVGKDCEFFPGASIGGAPQDLKFKGEVTYAHIGDRVTVRECATINRACGEDCITKVGNDVLMMAYTHIAHNCIVGNNVIMSNVATLGGHVIVEDRAVIGGLAAVHQFCKIGRNVMVGGMSRITQDVAPFVTVAGDPSFVSGLNSVGLARAGVTKEVRSELKRAYRILYRSGLTLPEAIKRMEQELTSAEEIEHLLRFLRNVERGICRGRRD